MLEGMIILAFCVILFGSMLFNISMIIALLFGMVLFLLYGLSKGYHLLDLILAAFKSSMKSKNIMIILSLIGIMTGLWRASGTIAYIVSKLTGIFFPSIMLVTIFLANSAVSFLIGTSFGTAASMGTICMTIANLMGISPILAGGAVISGCFFGDRCSPLSSSAALVASVTDTDLYTNIKNMMKTGLIPFILSIGIYGVLGFVNASAVTYQATDSFYNEAYHLSIWCFVPALFVLILALLRISVIINIAISSLFSFMLGVFIQNIHPYELLKIALLGFHSTDPKLSTLNGGGFTSMIHVILIVLIASGYAGIFETTGMIEKLSGIIGKMSKKITPFGSMLVVSLISCGLACNQSLPTILIAQLCQESVPDKEKLAIYIENSVILIAALIPWSIAISVPASTIGAPLTCILAACYLYLVPMCQLIQELLKHVKLQHYSNS